jgi:hypothetical protein
VNGASREEPKQTAAGENPPGKEELFSVGDLVVLWHTVAYYKIFSRKTITV